MKNFPKKYNYETNIYNQKKFITWSKIYWPLLPADQKLNPSQVFSLFLQSLYCETKSLQDEKCKLNIDFGLSSNFYSTLNDFDAKAFHLYNTASKHVEQNIKFLEKLNLWGDIKWQYDIFSEEFNIFLRKVFVDLFQNDKILSQEEVAYRSKSLQTNFFSNNIKNEDKKVTQYNLKYFIDSKWNALSIQTTDLHTIFADVAVAVNPQDKRYKKLIWQKLIIPIINKSIPIIWDEDIDSFQWSGVHRVTPWHDEFGLYLAKKHDLPTDIFAVDIYGNFTKHAWEFANKPVSDFLGNIEKYIDDIWNLESKETIKISRHTNKNSWEILDKITLKQRSLQYSYAIDYLLQQFEDKKISFSPDLDLTQIRSFLQDNTNVNISNKSYKGISIPIVYWEKWDLFPINDDIIHQNYKNQKSKKYLTPTLILSNLVLDNLLPLSFSIDDLVNILFTVSRHDKKTKLERYIDIYQQKSKESRNYARWLKDLQKLLSKVDKDSEKIVLLLDILKDSFAIKTEWYNIMLNISSIYNKRQELTINQEDSFNKSFVDSVFFIYKNKLDFDKWPYDKIRILSGEFFINQDNIDFVLNLLLLGVEYSKRILFDKISLQHNLINTQNEKINDGNSKFLTKDFWDALKKYGPDVVRISSLLWSKDNMNVVFDISSFEDYNQLINKIWNASRYVYKNYISQHKNIKIKSLTKKITKDLSDYDLWIIHVLKSIIDDYEYQIRENKSLDLWHKLFSFFKNTLCDKYLECIKTESADNTWYTLILIFSLSLRLLKPYLPWFVQKIEKIFDIDRWDYNVFDFQKFNPEEKNYKINLLMDIVSKIRELKQKNWSKKHESVCIFVQANPDFLDFLSNNEVLLSSLINISDIVYVKPHENIPMWYDSDNVININVWIKKVETQKIKKDVLWEMEKGLQEKLEQLQHLKSLISSVMQVANPEIISQKKNEIFKLQKEIDELQLNINKAKSK